MNLLRLLFAMWKRRKARLELSYHRYLVRSLERDLNDMRNLTFQAERDFDEATSNVQAVKNEIRFPFAPRLR